MTRIKSILFPIIDNDAAIEYAIGLAQGEKAKLYLLHSYRLNHPKHGVKKAGSRSLKSSLDETLEKEFETKYAERLKKSGIDFEWRIEVGFLIDRIIANVEEHDIDVVLLKEKEKIDLLKEQLDGLNIQVLSIP